MDLMIKNNHLSLFYLEKKRECIGQAHSIYDVNQKGVIFMDKQLDEQKIENLVSKNGDTLSSFDDFKGFLSGKVRLGENLGLDEEQLANSAQKVADYLAGKERPKNSEERLLQELWKVGTEEEQHKLAHMLVRLVKQS